MKNNKEIHILNREGAEECTVDKPYAVISITDTKSVDANIPQTENLRGVLILKYDDIDNQRDEFFGYRMFNKTQAKRVGKFVRAMAKYVKAFIVHCEAGISRSSATAAAVSLYLNGDDKWVWMNRNYNPNPIVYNLLIEELGFGREREVYGRRNYWGENSQHFHCPSLEEYEVAEDAS